MKYFCCLIVVDGVLWLVKCNFETLTIFNCGQCSVPIAIAVQNNECVELYAFNLVVAFSSEKYQHLQRKPFGICNKLDSWCKYVGQIYVEQQCRSYSVVSQSLYRLICVELPSNDQQPYS
jgi:hypothetical protein